MYSDPKDCLYCTNNETQHNLMIEIAHLGVSRAFLFKEQTYHGRCLVAYDGHVNDLNELSDEQRNAFMADVVRMTRATDKMEELLFSDDYKKLPRDLQLIRETRDMILQTVRINNPPVDTSKLTEGVITH